jgi:hypothetical protein
MKRFLLFFLISLVAALLLVWKLQPAPNLDAAAYIPDTALFYAEQEEVETFLYDLSHSRLGKTVQAIDITKIGKDLQLGEKEIAAIEKAETLIRDNWNSQIIKEIFGKKVAFAFLQPLTTTPYSNFTDYLRDNTVLITRPGYKVEFMRLIAERYAVYRKDISVTSHQYGDYHIKRIEIDNDIISAVAMGGFILISFEEAQLRKCIDTFDQELPSLAEDKDYSRLRDHYSSPDQYMYLGLGSIREYITTHLSLYDFPGRDVVDKELAGTAGFAGFSYGAWKNESLISDRIMVLYNREMINSALEERLNTAPSVCDTMRFSPRSPLVFYWTNIVDFELLYQLYSKKVGADDEKLKKFSKILQDQAGVSSDEFFTMLGKQFSYIITSGRKENSLPIPYGLMLFKVKEQAKLAMALEKLLASYNIPMKIGKYRQEQFRFWADTPQDGLTPLYGFLEDYFYIGNSRQLVKQVIDAIADDTNLLQDPRFQQVDLGLSRGNNYISYTDNVGMLAIAKTLLNLGSTMIAIENRDTAAKMRIVLKDIVDPLLDGLSMFDCTATRSYFTEDAVVIDSMTKIEN